MKLWILAPVLVLLDQGTKLLARTELVEHTINLFSGVRFQLAFNKGFAFSLPAPQLILIILAILVSGFLIHWSLKKERSCYERWASVLIASGAIGNAIDRMLFSEVTDFIACWSFPVFNVADILVSVGVGVLLIGEIWELNR